MHLLHGSLVGPYRILAPLGAGGMGEVYRARDERLNRDIALKVLSGELASSSDHLRRFQQEAHAASALNHPNIITIYDIGMASGETAYIAMELVDGQDLRSLYASERLQLKQILRIAVKVADGLAAAHERGIVHRDLKPENVMISRDGFVKILDFGLAKLVRPISETQTTAPHTTPGAVFGTVAYMSPEQAAGRPIDFRSDQFSLGVILYELLTGRMPFSEATAAETLAAIIRRDVPPPSELNDTVPPELDRIITRCLAKDPTERYASTRDLARDLREIRDRISNASEPRHRSDRPPVAPKRRMAWAAGATVGLVLVGVGTFMTLRERKATPPVQQHGPQSVAVLPFRDLSGTPEGQLFADGVTEMVRSRLAETRTIHVVPAFDVDPRVNPATVARQMNTTYAITGASHREGNQVHLSVSAISAANGEQVAGHTFDGSTSDIFSLQKRAVDLLLAGMNIRLETQERTVPTALSSAADQSAYVEALGLLQHTLDESSVDRAIKILTHLLDNARDSAMVNAQLARALLNKSQLAYRPGLVEQATVYAERAVEFDESLPEAHINLGRSRMMAGRYPDAEREYRRALAIRDDNADAYIGLAQTYAAMGRAADAEPMFKKALALRPNHGDTYNLYGLFLLKTGRLDEAAANLRRFTELMPTPRGFNNLGAVYQTLGNYAEARKAYEKAIALAPAAEAYTNLGSIAYFTGNYSDAIGAFQQAIAVSRASYQAWLGLADTYRVAGMREKANDAYEHVIEAARETTAVNPKDSLALACSANAQAKLGHVAQAQAESDRALKLDPTDNTVLYSAAVVAQVRGNRDVAVDWLQRAVSAGYPLNDLQHDPDFRTARADPAFPKQLTRKN